MPEVAKLTAPIKINVDKKTFAAAKKNIKEIAILLDEVANKINQTANNLGSALKKIDEANNKAGKGTARQVVAWDKYKEKATSALRTANREIRKQDKILKRLKKQIQGTTKETKKQGSQAKRTAKAWGKLPDIMAQIRTNLGLVEFAAAKVFQALALPTAAVAGSLLFLDRLNASTTEMVKLGKVSGVSFNFVKAMSTQAKLLGLNFQNVVDLAEELGNKVGGQASGFEEINLMEGLATLGVEFDKIKKLKPEDQFTKIASAAQKMLKSGKLTAQEIASAGDKIFGGEGNRLLTNLAQMNMSLDEFLERQKKITGLSDKMQEGAVRFTMAFNDLQGIAGKLFTMIAASVGGKIAPAIELMVNRFIEIEDVVSGIVDVFSDLFAGALVKGMALLGEAFLTFNENKAEIMTFFKNVAKLSRVLFKLGLSLLVISVKIINALEPFLSFALKTLAIIAAILAAIPQKVFDWLVPLIAVAGVALKITKVAQFLGRFTSKAGILKNLGFIGRWMKTIWFWVEKVITFVSGRAWMNKLMNFVLRLRFIIVNLLARINPVVALISTALAGLGIGSKISKSGALSKGVSLDDDDAIPDFLVRIFEGMEFKQRQARFQADRQLETFRSNNPRGGLGGNTTNNSGGNTFIDQRNFNLEGNDAVDAVNELMNGPLQVN